MDREASRTIAPSKDAPPAPRTSPRHAQRTLRMYRPAPNHQAPCFHNDARSFARRKLATAAFSSICALFCKNTRVGYPHLLTLILPAPCSTSFTRSVAKNHSATESTRRGGPLLRPALPPPRAVWYHARRNKIPNERLIPCFMKNSPVGDSTYIFRRPHGRALEVG